ncbi:MAG: LLM class F420-dependent oxidoreductase [Chloroflexi bacterium]|nr:LLM class F420-dependent oxidoreductase [Chloroflexota bacterium]
MKFGIFAPLANPFASADYLKTLGAAAEERGFDSIWVAEHVVLFDEYKSRYPYANDGRIPVPPESGILDPFVALSYLAAVTNTIRLGTGICLVPQRNPVYTAKEVATLDWLSDGRFDLGIGVGWLAEEFEALDVPFEHRGSRCRAYIDVMKTLWADPISEYSGEFYKLAPTRQFPKPIQQPHPPIHFGGESDAALRRVADLGQGWYGFNLEADQLNERIAHLETLLEERGRKRSDIEISVCPYLLSAGPELIERYQDAGVDRVILVASATEPDSLVKALDELASAFVVKMGVG